MSTKAEIDIAPARTVEGTLSVPGDKSISHRALLVGALADGPVEVTGLSPASDVQSSAAAVTLLGARLRSGGREILNPRVDPELWQTSISDRDFHLQVEAMGWDGLASPDEHIDVGNSGTTIRLLLGMLAGSRATATLDGDRSIRRRPMARVVEPLRTMGAHIEGVDWGALAPLTVRGAQLTGTDHVLPVASAQVKSALLLAGLRATGHTSVAEPEGSRDHTERMLRFLGIPIDKEGRRLIVKSTNIPGGSLTVPGDLSSAAFFLVAGAILPGSEVTVTGVGLNPTRSGILDLLRGYGANVEVDDLTDRSGEPVGTVTVRAGDRRPLEVTGSLTVRTIDELPLVGVLGALAEGRTIVSDAAELRVKESDRIEALTAGLAAMGAAITPTPDGFEVLGPCRLRGAEVGGAGDHRIAMALAVAAVAAEGPTRISGWDAVAVSYPGFERDLAAIVVP